MTDPTLRSAFGLREPPFTPEPDPRFFYLSDSFLNILSKAEYAYEHDMGPTVTCGDDGTGKTILTRVLWQRYKDRATATVVLMEAEPFLSANKFLRHLLLEFRVGKTAKAMEDSYDIFLGYLRAEVRAGRKPVLIIDRSDRLSPDDLALLARLDRETYGDVKLLRTMLFGAFALLPRVNESPEFLKRLSFTSFQESLAFDEMVEMLDFEWHVAGGKSLPFDAATLHRIYSSTHGNPREINILAGAELEHMAAGMPKPKKAKKG